MPSRTRSPTASLATANFNSCKSANVLLQILHFSVFLKVSQISELICKVLLDVDVGADQMNVNQGDNIGYQKMLKIAYLDAKICVDAAENECSGKYG